MSHSDWWSGSVHAAFACMRTARAYVRMQGAYGRRPPGCFRAQRMSRAAASRRGARRGSRRRRATRRAGAVAAARPAVAARCSRGRRRGRASSSTPKVRLPRAARLSSQPANTTAADEHVPGSAADEHPRKRFKSCSKSKLCLQTSKSSPLFGCRPHPSAAGRLRIAPGLGDGALGTDRGGRHTDMGPRREQPSRASRRRLLPQDI